MINWISADKPPMVDEYSGAYDYLVTVEYDGEGSVNGRATFVMTYEFRGRKQTPTWCWKDRPSKWKVLYWAELPEACQDQQGVNT